MAESRESVDAKQFLIAIFNNLLDKMYVLIVEEEIEEKINGVPNHKLIQKIKLNMEKLVELILFIYSFNLEKIEQMFLTQPAGGIRIFNPKYNVNKDIVNFPDLQQDIRCISIYPFCKNYNDIVMLLSILLFHMIKFIINKNPQFLSRLQVFNNTNSKILYQFNDLQYLDVHIENNNLFFTKSSNIKNDNMHALFEGSSINDLKYSYLCMRTKKSKWTLDNLKFFGIFIDIVVTNILPQILISIMSNLDDYNLNNYINTMNTCEKEYLQFINNTSMIQVSYENKYLKYKNKYLNLKKQLEGREL